MNILEKKFNNLIKKIFVFWVLSIILIFSNFFVSCKNNGNVLDFYHFNTVIHVESYSKKIEEKVKENIESFLIDIENKISVNIPSSTIATFNSSKSETPILLDDYSFDILKKTLYGNESAFYKTNGKFNISVLPLTKLWKLSADTFNSQEIITSIPTITEIDKVKVFCDLGKIALDIERKTLTKYDDNVEIDLGGIAKGYIAEKIVSTLKENGIYDGYISLGSSSLYIFNVNSLSIRHPRRNQNLSEIIKLNGSLIENKHISTSGDYERYYEYEGVRYCHIIDTETGAPTQTGIISATVIGEDGAFLDALSTTLILMKYEPYDHENSELIKYIKTLDGENIKYFICYDKEEKILLTNYDKESFTLLDDSYKIKKI